MTSSRPAVILVVEDNCGDVVLILQALVAHRIDHSIQVASDGEEAIDYLICAAKAGASLPKPDLILLDMNLPRRSGLEVLQHLRKDGPLANTPVILMSSMLFQPEQIPKDVMAFFTKPPDVDEFMKIGGLVKETLRGGVHDVA